MNLENIVGTFNIPVLAALLLGFLTAVSPCPLATNMAAIGYVSRGMKNKRNAVLTGVLYTAGRMFSYTVIGMLIIAAGLETTGISMLLQGIGEQILGPLLIAVGLLMLIAHRISFGRGGGKIAALGAKVANRGLVGGFLLGVIFALAFCPYSAVLFFGMLVPIALNANEGIFLPAVYAIGTGFPVLVIGTLLSVGIAGVSSWLNAISRTERILRIVVSIAFIGIGIYYVVLWLKA